MIRLRLPVEAHHFGRDPREELYEMLGYRVTSAPDGTVSVEMPTGFLDPRELPSVTLNTQFRGPMTLELGFRDYALSLTEGQYLVKISTHFTVIDAATFDQFVVESEW